MKLMGTTIRTMLRGRRDRAHAMPKSLAERFPDIDATTLGHIEACRAFTMTSPERLLALIQAVDYVSQHQIPGDIVECGVWKGGSMMAVARTLVANGGTDRDLRLFDTFEGMPPADDVDRDLRGNSATRLLAEEDPLTSKVWAIAQLEEVVRNLSTTGYPSERIHYIKGKVEDTIPQQAPPSISLLRLDTDWYTSTRHELVHLFPRLSPGGVLIIDDYGHWEGARRAVDEYIREHSLRLLLCRIDYTGRMAIKP
ncbi:MAG: TylF/MycF/NovP-related O-methyltransferase [Planctomycetaceae bacterium]